MGVDVTEYEITELVRRYSKTYREAVVSFIINGMRVGDQATYRELTDALEKNGFDVRDLPWWSQGRLLAQESRLKKVGKGTWQRVR